MKAAFRIFICLILIFVSVDIVKCILPTVSSQPWKFHRVSYSSVTSSVAQGVRYVSGRAVMDYSGGKNEDVDYRPWKGIGIVINAYSIAVRFAAVIPSLPSVACEMLSGDKTLCILVRNLNAVAAAVYAVLIIAYFAVSGRFTIDISRTELTEIKRALGKKK